jgi:hypothetical protein
MLKEVPKRFRCFHLSAIGAGVDRSYPVVMGIANFTFAMVAIGTVCLLFYRRESVFAYRLTLLLSASFFFAQLFCNKWLREKQIAAQMLLLNLYLTTVAMTVLERDLLRKSILGLIFAFMSLRCLVEIRRTLAGARVAKAPSAQEAEEWLRSRLGRLRRR